MFYKISINTKLPAVAMLHIATALKQKTYVFYRRAQNFVLQRKITSNIQLAVLGIQTKSQTILCENSQKTTNFCKNHNTARP
jgi:hypothetical protein